MRKVIISLMLLFPLLVMASTKVGTPKCWTVPSIFTGDEQVTFYYVLNDVGFPEGDRPLSLGVATDRAGCR